MDDRLLIPKKVQLKPVEEPRVITELEARELSNQTNKRKLLEEASMCN